jgi:uncharacterized lipoprotein YajG
MTKIIAMIAAVLLLAGCAGANNCAGPFPITPGCIF